MTEMNVEKQTSPMILAAMQNLYGDDADVLRSVMSPQSFRQEYCTLEFRLPRRVGKTTTIINRFLAFSQANMNVVIFTHNQHSALDITEMLIRRGVDVGKAKASVHVVNKMEAVFLNPEADIAVAFFDECLPERINYLPDSVSHTLFVSYRT